MTITKTYAPDKYAGDGVQVDFPVTFDFLDSGNIKATVTDAAGVDTALVAGVDYSVTGATLTTNVPVASGSRLTIWLDADYLQDTDWKNTGNYNLETLERAMDKAAVERQILKEAFSRTVTLPLTSEDTPENYLGQVRAARDAAVTARGGAEAAQAAAESAASTAASDTVAAADSLLSSYVSSAEASKTAAEQAQTAASTEAANAAASAADAEETLKDFRNIYYGPRSSDPTTRPDGSAMQDGDLYKNTATTTLRVYDATSGIWVDASTGSVSLPISVKEFGAVGDGVTDDTAAIQAAITAAPVCATINFDSKDTYLISAQITVNKRLHLRFNGAKIKEGSNLGVPLFLCTSFTDGSIDGLTVEGAETPSTYAGASALTYVAVQINSSDRVNVSNVKVFDKSNAVIFSTCNECVAESVYLDGVITSYVAADFNSCAVRFVAGAQNRAVLCGAENAGGAVYQTNDGRQLSVVGAWAQDCWDNGVYISSGFDCTVSGGTFRRLNGEGSVGVKARGSGHTIFGNTVEGSFAGIQVSGNGVTPDAENANGSGTVVVGNIIRNVTQSGIVVNFQDGYEPRDFTVSNNQLVNVATGGGDNAAILLRGNGHYVVGNTVNGFGGSYAIMSTGPSGNLYRRLKIFGNRIRGGGANDGIRLVYVGDSEVDGNWFDGNSAADFIELRFCDGVRVINNSCPTATINAPSGYPSTNLEVWGNKALNLFVTGDQQFQPNNSWLTLAMGNASLAVSVVRAQAQTLELTGDFTAQRTLTLPTIRRQWTIFANTTGGFGVNVRTAAGSGVVVADGKRAILACDGTNIVRVTADV
jgi:hypothetical protein